MLSPNTSVAFCVYICVSVYIIWKKERKKMEGEISVVFVVILMERKKERKVWSLTFFVVIFKERKEKLKRKNEWIMWFVACHIERERKRKQTSCQESRLMSQQNSFFSFWVCLLAYVSFESTLRTTRKRERKSESLHLLTTQTIWIFQITLSLLHESRVFYYNNIQDTFHLLFYSFQILKFLKICIIKKIF